MPDPYPASEFGGKSQENKVQPPKTPLGDPGHEPTASEKLMLVYTTGSEDGINPFTGKPAPDDGESFQGMLPMIERIKQAKAEGIVHPRETIDDMTYGKRRGDQ